MLISGLRTRRTHCVERTISIIAMSHVGSVQPHVLKLSLVGVHVRTHVNDGLAHVSVDDHVSQVIDMEMSNQ